jgi:hypothetical protein
MHDIHIMLSHFSMWFHLSSWCQSYQQSKQRKTEKSDIPTYTSFQLRLQFCVYIFNTTASQVEIHYCENVHDSSTYITHWLPDTLRPRGQLLIPPSALSKYKQTLSYSKHMLVWQWIWWKMFQNCIIETVMEKMFYRVCHRPLYIAL